MTDGLDITEAKRILKAVIKFKSKEIHYDKFAYDRIVGSYRSWARMALDCLKKGKP